jgi:serine O-acetyltransferase
MFTNFMQIVLTRHQQKRQIPCPIELENFIKGLLSMLIPAFSDCMIHDMAELHIAFEKNKQDLEKILLYWKDEMHDDIEEQIIAYYRALPAIEDLLMKDASAILFGDSAAKSIDEVLSTYPGFFAICIYRLAHQLHVQKIPFLPRMLTEYAHSKTGIDIHPGAEIGQHFFIDHGTGIVIGETTSIGDHVKLYQGVTLGALSVKKEMADTKRHPTIKDHVVIYAGATILGGETIIGEHTTIGGNVWVTQSIDPYVSVYNEPKLIFKKKNGHGYTH